MKLLTSISGIILLTYCGLVACKKPIGTAVILTASGVVFDSVKYKPIPNATLYVYGATSRLYRGMVYDHGPLDSTVSDNNGNFNIRFNGHGLYKDYGLRVGKYNYDGFNYSSDEINAAIDLRMPIFKFDYKHRIRNAVISGRELNYTKIHLVVPNNPFDSFFVRSDVAGITTLIKGQSIDTTITVRHLPLYHNRIDYFIQSLRDTAGYGRPSYSLRRTVTDTLFADLTDTLHRTKIISDVLAMPRRY